MKGFTSVLVAALAGHAFAAPAEPPTRVLQERVARATVVLAPSSTVIGSASASVDEFRGIPYAVPPVGSLRLKPPVRRTAALGTFDATAIEAACPQFLLGTTGNDLLTDVLAEVGQLLDTPLFQTVTTQSEDCLTINVVRPAGTQAGDNLPVLFWIFGGGFELGWTSMYDGASLVSNAVANGKPFVFVAVNYRVGSLGFLPGKEILQDGSANLGLLDQRLGLEWTADNIAAFGGDPDKVTIWGESAGSISVLDHMILYDGNNQYNGKALFRGAIMNSGSIVPADPVDCPKGQLVYDTVVNAAGCSGSDDTLACLRSLTIEQMLDAGNSVPGILSYNGVALSYLPRPDGTAITDSPDVLITQGKYAAVPMIIGDQEDEGTLFSLFQSNTTSTTAKLVDYFHKVFFQDATTEELTELVNTYNPSPTAGSPFRTGLLNEVYPGFKRLAAMIGDLVFTLTRRAFLTTAIGVHPDVPAWSYLSSYDYGTPILGSFHAGDVLQVFYGILPDYASLSIQNYYVNFVYNLDPNDASGGTSAKSQVAMAWPQWKEAGQLMNFYNLGAKLISDDFRADSFEFILGHVAQLHI